MSEPLLSDGPEPIEAAYGFLAAGTFAAGEIALTCRTRDGEMADRSLFASALALHALADSKRPAARGFRERSVPRLAAERERDGLWRFWPAGHPRHSEIPPDLEDTASAAAALVAAGRDPGVDLRRFDAQRDGEGRFRTWFVDPDSPFAAADHPFWRDTEARPDDVDAGANAQAVLFLAAVGEGARARQAALWLLDVVDSGAEEIADKWYHSAALVRYLVARAARRAEELRPARVAIANSIRGDLARHLSSESAPEIATTLAAAAECGVGPRELAPLAGRLLSLQRSDGSFDRAPVWYGGPKQSVDWGSRELSTVFAIEALEALERGVSGAPRS